MKKSILATCVLLASGCAQYKVGTCAIVLDGPMKGKFGYVQYIENDVAFIETKDSSLVITDAPLFTMPGRYCEDLRGPR